MLNINLKNNKQQFNNLLFSQIFRYSIKNKKYLEIYILDILVHAKERYIT